MDNQPENPSIFGPVQGRQRAELLLERVAILTEPKASKVVQMAAERGLYSAVTSTCKVRGMRALQASNTGPAVGWAHQSGDAKLTTFLMDKLLSEYASSSTVRMRIILAIETPFIGIKCIKCNAIICISAGLVVVFPLSLILTVSFRTFVTCKS